MTGAVVPVDGGATARAYPIADRPGPAADTQRGSDRRQGARRDAATSIAAVKLTIDTQVLSLPLRDPFRIARDEDDRTATTVIVTIATSGLEGWARRSRSPTTARPWAPSAWCCRSWRVSWRPRRAAHEPGRRPCLAYATRRQYVSFCWRPLDSSSCWWNPPGFAEGIPLGARSTARLLGGHSSGDTRPTPESRSARARRRRRSSLPMMRPRCPSTVLTLRWSSRAMSSSRFPSPTS